MVSSLCCALSFLMCTVNQLKNILILIIIMVVTCFNDQYSKAKTQILEAIDSRQNIVLWGEGCNGKTHLTTEMFRDNKMVNYVRLFEDELPSSLKKNNFVIECTNINYVTKDLSDESFVFINMNMFKYPEYTKLRSGKK